MLHLNHLKKSFGRNEILTDVEYTFEEGNIYPVLGGAGAGRTTLFECIAGDIPVDSGTVETKEKCTLFFAAKQSVLPMLITGYQFISMLCDMNKNSEKPEYYLDKVKLTGLIRDRHIGDYSFEEKKRLQLAAFLIQKPYVMMFDEALDYCTDEYVDDMLSVLNEVKNEHIILISTGLLDVEREKKRAQNELRGEISELAVLVAQQVVEKEITEADHERFINDFIENVGDLK